MLVMEADFIWIPYKFEPRFWPIWQMSSKAAPLPYNEKTILYKIVKIAKFKMCNFLERKEIYRFRTFLNDFLPFI